MREPPHLVIVTCFWLDGPMLELAASTYGEHAQQNALAGPGSGVLPPWQWSDGSGFESQNKTYSSALHCSQQSPGMTAPSGPTTAPSASVVLLFGAL
jgi:hypothetical protein